ncbi:MAG: hypothetical protein GF364_17465 [Candidatus Lokiarchaeota archaeon]|nr:hypothetical protein [Candidatus Lokiarchaeota archaeon]
MPGFAHIVVALGLSVILNKMTDNKFKIKHAVIFTINAFVGPDLMGIFFGYQSGAYLFTHGYGWFVVAIPIALLWSVYTHFKLQWRPFKIERRNPNKESVITYAEVLCLVIAGGIFHQTMDLIGHPSYIDWLVDGELLENAPWGVVWFGWENYFSIEAIWSTGMFPCGFELGFLESYIFLGIIVPISVFLVFGVMQKNRKAFYRTSIFIMLMYTIPLIIAYFIPDMSGFDVTAEGVNFYGDPSDVRYVYRLTGGEADLGVIVYFVLFLFVPLIFIYWGFSGVPGLKKTGFRAKIEKIEAEEKKRKKMKIKELTS